MRIVICFINRYVSSYKHNFEFILFTFFFIIIIVGEYLPTFECINVCVFPRFLVNLIHRLRNK